MAFPLTPGIKNYAWGSRGPLSEFLGKPVANLPEAEAWFGGHPLSETRVKVAAEEVLLRDWLRLRGSEFDVLVKILSAAAPLSIQVHPNEEIAHAGFHSEERRGVPADSPERVFSDARPKPELIVALSAGFKALVGFVPSDLFRRRIENLVSVGALPQDSKSWCSSTSYPRRFVESVVQAGDDVMLAVDEVSAWIASDADFSLFSGLGLDQSSLEQITRSYPKDAGILLALAMHHMELAEGEALFVAPGVVHAYVGGLGLEVMVPSDNVIRAGLTNKTRHPEVFLQIANLWPMKTPEWVVPQHDFGAYVYSFPAMPFELTRIEVGGDAFHVKEDSIIVVEAGTVRIEGAGAPLTIEQGGAAFLEPAEVVSTVGPGARAWIARG